MTSAHATGAEPGSQRDLAQRLGRQRAHWYGRRYSLYDLAWLLLGWTRFPPVCSGRLLRYPILANEGASWGSCAARGTLVASSAASCVCPVPRLRWSPQRLRMRQFALTRRRYCRCKLTADWLSSSVGTVRLAASRIFPSAPLRLCVYEMRLPRGRHATTTKGT